MFHRQGSRHKNSRMLPRLSCTITNYWSQDWNSGNEPQSEREGRTQPTKQSVTQGVGGRLCFWKRLQQYPSCFCLCSLIKHNSIVVPVLGMETMRVCSPTPMPKQNPETKIHVQVVYWGGDPRKHGKQKWDRNGKAPVEEMLSSKWPLWTTGAQSHRGMLGNSTETRLSYLCTKSLCLAAWEVILEGWTL